MEEGKGTVESREEGRAVVWNMIPLGPLQRLTTNDDYAATSPMDREPMQLVLRA